MNDKLKEDFINREIEKHGNKYDYSKIEYVNNKTKVCIICPEHGEFWMMPRNHTHGQGCPKCGVKRRSANRTKTQEEILTKFKEVHGDKYDYSKFVYEGIDNKSCIICPKHGEFWQTPYHHIHGCGCPICSGNQKLNIEDFIERARKIHGDKYDYSKVEYINTGTKVCIICPEHGEFWQTPQNHLYGQGCPKCVGKNKTTEEFIKDCIDIHGDKYDFSKTVYNGAFNKVTVICKEHGEFKIAPHDLLGGKGCSKCGDIQSATKQRKKLDEFKNEVETIYGKGYLDLSKVNYINAHTPVIIISPELGERKITPNKLLSGVGCKLFNESSYEHDIKLVLDKNKIKFSKEKTFEWLKYNGLLRLDFYLPDYNMAIECQGRQHFTRLKHYYNQYDFDKQLEKDNIKYKLCKENGIKIVYYTHKENMIFENYYEIYKNNLFDNPDSIIENITILNNK